MRGLRSSFKRERGFTLLEVLVSLVILVFGLLGIIGMQAFTQVAAFESYQRGQALILVQDMADRLATNRGAAGCYPITTNTTSGTPFLGTSGAAPVCVNPGAASSPLLVPVANADLAAWDAALKGAAEQTGGASVGAVLGARGCISFDGVNAYRVAVAWQGMAATVAPIAPATCGLNQYGPEAQRREVSVTVRIANLTAP